MNEHIKPRIALRGFTSFRMLSIFVLLILIAGSNLVIGFSEVTTRNNNPISDFDHLAEQYYNDIENQLINSILQFTFLKDKPRDEQHINNDPYGYRYRILMKRSELEKAPSRMNLDNPFREKRLLPFKSMLLSAINSNQKNKQFLREVEMVENPLLAAEMKSNRQVKSDIDMKDDDTFYKTYPSAASRITKRLYPYTNLRIFSDMYPSSTNSIIKGYQRAPNRLQMKLLNKSGNDHHNNSDLRYDCFRYARCLTMPKSKSSPLKNMQLQSYGDEINKIHDQVNTIHRKNRLQVKRLCLIINILSFYNRKD